MTSPEEDKVIAAKPRTLRSIVIRIYFGLSAHSEHALKNIPDPPLNAIVSTDYLPKPK